MIKRLFDLLTCLTLFIVLFPVILLVGLLLLNFNKGSGIFFTQARTGKNAKIFHIIKFKTMTDQRDYRGNLLPDHERLTTIGSFIRSTSLDELPQIFNVIKGDMSLVGPRPLLVRYIPLYSKVQFRRHEVKPGITGWAQVNGRNNISWAKKFDLDVWYVDNHGFLLDMQILWLTLKNVIMRKNITTEDPKAFQPFNGTN
ncbi:MAG: sugar transferase [Chitinophagia bacterium]|nr:sugar transferase [Chitinophagia bacterium]